MTFSVSVDIHGQPSTSSNYSNIHLQRQAQLAQAEADENEEERPLALIGSPLALRNKSSKHSNKQRSEELLPMETTTTVEYIAETAFNSSPIAEQAVRQSKVARTSSSSAIPIPFSGSIVQGKQLT